MTQVTSLGLTLYNPFPLKNTKCIQHFSSSHMTKIPAVKDKLKLRHILLFAILFQVPEEKNQLTCKVRPIVISAEFRELERGEDPYAEGIGLRWASWQHCEHAKAVTRLKWGGKTTKKPPQNQKRPTMDTMQQHLAFISNASFWKKLEKSKHCLQTVSALIY